jgi:hypothetical protein
MLLLMVIAEYGARLTVDTADADVRRSARYVPDRLSVTGIETETFCLLQHFKYRTAFQLRL